MPQKDTRITIMQAMIRAGKPLILSHIAKRAKKDIQLVAYHLEQLVKEGIVYTYSGEEDELTYYYLAAPFYDEDNMNALYALLTPYVQQTREIMENAEPDVILAIMKYQLLLFVNKMQTG